MTRTIAHKRRQARRTNTAPWVFLSMGAAVLLVVVLVVWNLASGTPTSSAPALSDGRVWGQANAPVDIEVFSDFQCPFCARADAMLHQIAPAYFDTGKAKVTYRYFAFLGDESQWAANAAECAGEQGQFWAFANTLFTHQAGENAGAFTRSNLKQFAGGLGLAPGAFNACVDGNRYTGTVQQDTREGRQRGVFSTPTFFVNGRKIDGVLSSTQFTALLDSSQTK
jgi:protein-disulfide isomerase